MIYRAYEMMGVTITEWVNITKYVFINIHYLRIKKNDGESYHSDVSAFNFRGPQVM